MDNETKGTLLVLLTALSSGLAIVINRFFVLKVEPVIFTAIRALFIGILFFFLSKRFETTPPQVNLRQLFSLGLIGGSVAFLLFFTGLKMTTGGRAAFIHKTLPIWVAILAVWFLKEKLSKIHVVAVSIALIGLAVMESGNLPGTITNGDLLILAATLLWAVENTLAKKFMNLGESNWRVTFGRMFFGSLILFGFAAFVGKLPLVFYLQPMQWLYIAVSTLMLTIYVLTWYWGLRYINLSKATGLLLVSPVISLISGVIILGEIIYPLQLIGSLGILIGCGLLAKTKSERMVSASELP
ncbi:MAG: DMT family transporter [Candidatus Altiarchaeota archaeon]|nr:DMT family transporter [Candidatus Altiarchaeota archaeon]